VIKPAAGYQGPLAYSSPEAVQTTGTVAVWLIHWPASRGTTDHITTKKSVASVPEPPTDRQADRQAVGLGDGNAHLRDAGQPAVGAQAEE
jgi:hypothetical protein